MKEIYYKSKFPKSTLRAKVILYTMDSLEAHCNSGPMAGHRWARYDGSLVGRECSLAYDTIRNSARNFAYLKGSDLRIIYTSVNISEFLLLFI